MSSSEENNVDAELVEEIRELLGEFRSATRQMKIHQNKAAEWADKRAIAQVELHFAEKDANDATIRAAHAKKKRERDDEEEKKEEDASPPKKKAEPKKPKKDAPKKTKKTKKVEEEKKE